MTGAAATQPRTFITSKQSKHPPSGCIHQQIREKSESIASHMTEAAATQWRTVISSKLLKYHPSSGSHQPIVLLFLLEQGLADQDSEELTPLFHGTR